jgi:hypothetical protein
VKNSCRVKFDEYLDLSNYTTSGALSTIPSLPISSPTPSASSSRSSTPTPSLYSRQQTIYRLSAIVCHYGQHSFGHYVAYRRKPRPETAGAARWAPPRLSCPLGCQCEKCVLYGPVRDDSFPLPSSRRGGGWLRISDSTVEEVGIETVLAEQSGTFMLYYEKVLPPPPPPPMLYAESVRTRSSEETVVATPTPPSATHNTTPAHAPERRKRTHSVANNEHEEEKQVTDNVEQMTGPYPRPDLHLPLVNGEYVGVAARIIRSTSVGVRSGSQESRSRSSSVVPPLPPTTNAMNVANGHAAPAAAAAATVQGPPHTLKVDRMMAHGPPAKQTQSHTRKRKKKNPNGFSKGDVKINGTTSRTLVGSGSIDR